MRTLSKFVGGVCLALVPALQSAYAQQVMTPEIKPQSTQQGAQEVAIDVAPSTVTATANPLAPVTAPTVTLHQAEIIPQNAPFYSVDMLPTPSAITGEQSFAVTDAMLAQAMSILLVRLTGKTVLLQTPQGEQLIANASALLKSFNRVPEIEDGVKVGEKLRINFDERSVEKAFAQLGFTTWPQALRPRTLVMGTLVEQGALTKLTLDESYYRHDFSVKKPSIELALPLSLPKLADVWIFPVDAKNNLFQIQEVLQATANNNLLSFKLSKLADMDELSWRLFTESGEEILKGRVRGDDRQQLMNQMITSVMARYVDRSDQVLNREDELRVNLLQVASADLLIQAQEAMQQQLPTLTALHLEEIRGSLAKFDIAFKGDFTDLVQWISEIPGFTILNQSQILGQVDVTFVPPPPEETLEENLPENLQGNSKAPVEVISVQAQ